MKTLSIDIETYSDIPLQKTGVYRYCESPNFEILLFGYSIDSGPAQVVDLACGEHIPKEVLAALEDDSIIKWAFNAAFERVCLSRYLGYPTGEYLDPESWHCFMVWAATMGLPLSLEGVGAVLGLEKQKLTEGKELIKYLTYNGIAQQLTDDGILSPGGKPKWNTSAVKSILSNEKYKGCALLQKTYTVDYLTKKKKVNEGEIPQYYVEDNHEAIIDPDTFEMVQREMEKRGKGRKYHSGVHTFSSKIRCGECGSWYGSKVWHSNSKYRKVIWQCNHKFDGDKHCSTPHLTDDIIQQAFLSAANKLLATKDTVIADGREMMALLFDTTDLEREQEELQQETQVVSDMVQQCIYENAHVALDQTEYQKRYDGLTERFEKAKARLDAVTAIIHQMQTQRASIEDFLKAFAAMPDELTEFTLESWHGLVDYGTVYSADDIRFTFKNGQEVKA